MDFKPNASFVEDAKKAARPKLQLACKELVRYIKTIKLSRGRREQGDVLGSGEPPYSRFGTLRQSVTQRWKEGDPDTQQVGSSARHARVQELGATISPGKTMTIPLSYEAVLHMNKPGATARTFPKTLTMIPSSGRRGIYFLVEGKRHGSKNARRSIIHFLLAKSVTIRPHPWLVPSLTEFGPEMLKIMGS